MFLPAVSQDCGCYQVLPIPSLQSYPHMNNGFFFHSTSVELNGTRPSKLPVWLNPVMWSEVLMRCASSTRRFMASGRGCLVLTRLSCQLYLREVEVNHTHWRSLILPSCVHWWYGEGQKATSPSVLVDFLHMSDRPTTGGYTQILSMVGCHYSLSVSLL